MMWLLKWLVFGHVHHWDTIEVRKLNIADSDITGTRYHLRCTKCGDVKKRDLI